MKRVTGKTFALVLLGLAALLIAVCFVSLHVGLGEVRVWDAFDHDAPNHVLASDVIIGERLPRILIAVVVGIALSAAGVVFQALLRNPLADPYILGVSGGSALGAVISIAFGIELQVLGFDGTFAFAFGGAMLALTLIYSLARVGAAVQTHTLLLAGVIVNSFSGACIIFLLTTVKSDKVGSIMDWIIGSVNAWRFVGYERLAAVALLIGAGFAVVFANGRALNLFTLGERAAEQLGVESARSRLVLLVASSFMTAAAVSMCGPIGFVGLIIPHALRLVLGPDHRLLLPAAGLFGASFLVACDTLGRVAFSVLVPSRRASEIPVGVITAILGGPFFLVLLKRRRKRATFEQP